MKPPAYAIQLPEVWSTLRRHEDELAEPEARHWVAIADDGRAWPWPPSTGRNPAPDSHAATGCPSP